MRQAVRTALVSGLVLGAVAATAPAHAAGPTTTGTRPAAPREQGLRVPLLSARRVPDMFTSPIAEERLRQKIVPIADRAPDASCLAVSVHGRPVLRHRADVPLEPASLMKLVTATAVLRRFAPDHPVATAVVAAADPAGGVVNGDLWLVGGGDGLLTTEGYRATLRDRDQKVVAFSQLADAIKARGVTEVRGSVIGDDSRYDTVRYVPSWPSRYRGQDTVGPLSALMVNDGVTGLEREPDRPVATRKPGDPPLAAAATLTSLLQARGVTVTGAPSAGHAPGGSRELARIQSTIFDQVDEMLAWSDNTTAELLTKEIGRRASGSGTTAAGLADTMAVLRELGVPTTGTVLIDGSGLDPGNRFTCDLAIGLLDKAGPASPLAKGLAVTGQKGTLLPRMRRTAAEGNVFAKTGTLSTVASLAGFVRTRSGEIVTFAFIQNGTKLDLGLQDDLAALLHAFPEAPDLADLVPPPA